MNLLPDVERPDLARRRGLLAMLAVTSGLAGCNRQRMAPDVGYILLDGSAGRTGALRGQVVVLNFWATSCAPCVAGMPALVAAHQRFASQGLVMLAVAMQYDAPAVVAQFAQSRQLPFGVVIDHTGSVARAFDDVQQTPTHVVIDKHGGIAWQGTGELDMARLSRLLAST